MSGPRAVQCVICKGKDEHAAGCPNGVALAADPLPAGVIRVEPEQLDLATETARAAVQAMRLLELQALRSRVIGTSEGPAVLWADIDRLLPYPVPTQ